MTTVYLKEYETLPENTLGHLSSAQTMPRWTAGSHSIPTQAFSPLKSLPVENQFTLTKTDDSEMVKDVEKNRVANQFTISSGTERTQQVRASVTVQPKTSPEYHSQLDSGFGQSMVYTQYSYGDQSYGVMSAYGPPMAGRMMLPLDLSSDDGPIYVNAKQYNGIIRRRLHRAKAELVSRTIKARKAYMHESRHLHALRRPRGCGGRFLKTKITDGGMSENSNSMITSHSPSSGIFQSDNVTQNSLKQTHTGIFNISGSEATSMYTRGNLCCFNANFTARPLPGIVAPPLLHCCCNLKA
nr:nuclear factor Y subunit A10 [Sedum plumbizincicola]